MSNVKYSPEEPICAIATALSPAALGLVRCSGKGCVELASKVFSRPNALVSSAGNSLVYGWLKKDGARIDEVMAAVYRSPKSFTGEDMVEFSCHGGPGVVLAVQNLLLENGFRQAEKGEFSFRAFINGKMDLTRTEAVKEIIESRTAEGRSHATGRLSGNLFAEIDSIKKLLTDTLAAIEVEIEYPEDEETIADSFDKKNLEDALVRLGRLSDSWKGEKLYQDGARVVICGKTNTGKSSLFNAILKEERAIVSDIEGTTRDWIESFVDFDGIPVRLFDTAGLRQTEDFVEAKGVEISKNLSQDADVILYLLDSSKGLSEEDKKFLEECKNPCVLAWNKSDLCQNPVQKNEFASVKSEVKISAKNSAGFAELYRAVKKVLTSGIIFAHDCAALGSERQKKYVEEALESVRHSIFVAEDGYSLDAVVQDLEDALNSLGEVTGEVCADDVLESIFNNFCVGK